MADLRDVFVPGGMPSYTYQSRADLKLEESLHGALHRLRKFIAIAGPTKSGKTVLVRRVVPPDEGVWVEGAHVDSIETFWSAALDAVSDLDGRSSSASAQDEVMPKRSQFSKDTPDSQSAQSVVATLLAAGKTVVIDDFHYIDSEVQTAIIRGLKQAVFDGLHVVLILIPHRMHQAATAEMDVDGRTQTLHIPEWQDKELFSIADTGARELAVRMHAGTIEAMVAESFRSPHLMQDFCSLLCADNNVWKTNVGALRTISFSITREEFFSRFAGTISPETFRALQKGPERTNRIERAMKSGGSCDTYEAVLLALKNLNVLTPVRWIELRRSLQDLLIDEPQQHEVTRVLEKMDEIAKSRGGEPVLDYVKESRELHLVDPFFRYYVRWGALVG